MLDSRIVTISQLEGMSCSPQMPIRDVLARMNASADLFHLVLDSFGSLLGTVTDGDVRRGLLSGANMDDAVLRFMNASPQKALFEELEHAKGRLAAIKSLVPFLPLVDQNGRVVAVLLQRHISHSIPAALIMAGGRGSRLGAKTNSTPKPLLMVGDRPILEHVIRHVETASIRDIFVSAFYLSDQIDRFCGERIGDAKLQVLTEISPSGTAGAISLLPVDLDGPLLVINGDVISNADLAAMRDLHHQQDWDATIAVARYEFEIPFGVVRVDENGRFLGVEEKPRVRNFVAAGIYILNQRIRKLVQRGQRLDMPELFEMGRRAGLTIGVFPIHESWRDVGRIADLEALNEEQIK